MILFACLINENRALAFECDNLRGRTGPLSLFQQHLGVGRMGIVAEQARDGFKLCAFAVRPAAMQDEPKNGSWRWMVG